jgi:hypothetical protein
METESDYVWLASRVKKTLLYLEQHSPQSHKILQEYVDMYFIPLLQGDLSIHDEDEYFDLMDIILDDFEEQYPEIFN